MKKKKKEVITTVYTEIKLCSNNFIHERKFSEFIRKFHFIHKIYNRKNENVLYRKTVHSYEKIKKKMLSFIRNILLDRMKSSFRVYERMKYNGNVDIRKSFVVKS